MLLDGQCKRVISTVETLSDPEPSCVGLASPHTVWYQFTPSEDMTIAADTSGSDYDTTLSVYTGERSSLSEVACDDDAMGLQSRVVFDATAGVTYFFMVGSYSYFDPPGGTLVFNVDVAPPPLEFDLRVDELGLGRPSTGEVVTITGEVECSRQAFGSISIDVEQQVGRFIVRGFGNTSFENCEGVTPWSITATGDNGLFVGGKMEVSAFAGAWTVDGEFPSFASDARDPGYGAAERHQLSPARPDRPGRSRPDQHLLTPYPR